MPETAPRQNIASILAHAKQRGRQTLSFEFYPFRDEAGSTTLWDTLERVQQAGADFVSLTYGAGGTSQERSFEVLKRMAPQLPTIGHLTAVGSSAASTRDIIHRYEDLGVASILALRGDSPKDDPDALARGELSTALELVELVAANSDLETGVAAFPEKHPESPDLAHDARLLARKGEAGARYAITQLFFTVEAYVELLAANRAAGATLEVIPGLMPISNAKQVLRMAEMSGASIPQPLLAKLSDLDETAARVAGMRYCVELAAELLAAGAPGLHIFTLNRHEGALQIAREVGLA
jgi:methylenetetrahydrofolate reductase (NADPH)